jgi:hypothetical protein
MLLIYVSAAQLLLQMVTMMITYRNRKRVVSGEPISYGSIDERDRIRIEYLKKNKEERYNLCEHDKAYTTCIFQFCQVFKDRELLQDTIHMCVEQQVSMFFNTVGHNIRNRLVGTNFDRSSEIVSAISTESFMPLVSYNLII